MNIEKRIAVEKRLIRKLVRVAKAKGYAVVRVVCDGEVLVKAPNENEVIDAVFSVDECVIRFKADKEPAVHCAVIVLGNDGWDAIADASMGPGWDEVMEEIFVYADKLCEACC